jgi:hypothetical protein
METEEILGVKPEPVAEVVSEPEGGVKQEAEESAENGKPESKLDNIKDAPNIVQLKTTQDKKETVKFSLT